MSENSIKNLLLIVGIILIGLAFLDVWHGALGVFSDIDKIIIKHHVDEVVFASADISTKDIIKSLIFLSEKGIKFKILPENSYFLIGSNSRLFKGNFSFFPRNAFVCKIHQNKMCICTA